MAAPRSSSSRSQPFEVSAACRKRRARRRSRRAEQARPEHRGARSIRGSSTRSLVARSRGARRRRKGIEVRIAFKNAKDANAGHRAQRRTKPTACTTRTSRSPAAEPRGDRDREIPRSSAATWRRERVAERRLVLLAAERVARVAIGAEHEDVGHARRSCTAAAACRRRPAPRPENLSVTDDALGVLLARRRRTRRRRSRSSAAPPRSPRGIVARQCEQVGVTNMTSAGLALEARGSSCHARATARQRRRDVAIGHGASRARWQPRIERERRSPRGLTTAEWHTRLIACPTWTWQTSLPS